SVRRRLPGPTLFPYTTLFRSRCAPTPMPGKLRGQVVTMRQVVRSCAMAGAARPVAAPTTAAPRRKLRRFIQVSLRLSARAVRAANCRLYFVQGYLVEGSSIAATWSLIAGWLARRITSSGSVDESELQRPSVKISNGWNRDL